MDTSDRFSSRAGAGHVVFSDDDREYFARSLDCRRIHSVAPLASNSLRMAPTTGESIRPNPWRSVLPEVGLMVFTSFVVRLHIDRGFVGLNVPQP
jgi:hypothetical protein